MNLRVLALSAVLMCHRSTAAANPEDMLRSFLGSALPQNASAMVSCPALELAAPGPVTQIVCSVDNALAYVPMVWQIGDQTINVTSSTASNAADNSKLRSYSVSTGFGRMNVTLVIPNGGQPRAQSLQLSVGGIPLGNVRFMAGFTLNSAAATTFAPAPWVMPMLRLLPLLLAPLAAFN